VGALAVQADGKVIVGAIYASGTGLFRRNPDGELDSSFAPGTGIIGQNSRVNAILAQPDNEILMGGEFDTVNGVPRLGLARLLGSPSAPTAAPARVNGQVTIGDGQPLAGVTMRISGRHTATTITDSAGRYSFERLETENFYIVTPQRANYSFSPASRSFSLVGKQDRCDLHGDG
jgi:hypothetical protein